MTSHIPTVAAKISATEEELREVIGLLKPHIAPCCDTQDCGISGPDELDPETPLCAHIALIKTVIGMLRKERSGQAAKDGSLATARTNLALAEAQLKEARARIVEMKARIAWLEEKENTYIALGTALAQSANQMADKINAIEDDET